MANTPTLTIRLPAELRGELEKRAKAENRSLGNYVVTLLAQSVSRKDRK